MSSWSPSAPLSTDALPRRRRGGVRGGNVRAFSSCWCESPKDLHEATVESIDLQVARWAPSFPTARSVVVYHMALRHRDIVSLHLEDAVRWLRQTFRLGSLGSRRPRAALWFCCVVPLTRTPALQKRRVRPVFPFRAIAGRASWVVTRRGTRAPRRRRVFWSSRASACQALQGWSTLPTTSRGASSALRSAVGTRAALATTSSTGRPSCWCT